MLKRTLALLSVVWASGCATNLSTMDTARTTPVKHVQVNMAYGIHAPLGWTSGLFDAGASMLQNKFDGKPVFTADEAEELYESALELALMPPAAIWQLQARTGILDDLDVGLRYSTTQLRLDTKYRFHHAGDDERRSSHAAIGFAVSKYLFSNPVFDWLGYIKIDGFSRWDFEVPLLYSFEYRRSFMFYCGAKYIYTRFSLDENLYNLQRKVVELADQPAIVDQVDSDMHFFGSVLGLGGGYKYVYVFTELSFGYVHSTPEMYSFIDKQKKPRDLGGVSIYPSIGLIVRI
ncbi:MAG: hypothetical protein ACOX6T_22435 [Myxococcales bacterium]